MKISCIVQVHFFIHIHFVESIDPLLIHSICPHPEEKNLGFEDQALVLNSNNFVCVFYNSV